MLGAARTISEFRGAATKARFERDRKTRSAVLHQLLVLGEASKRVSADVRAANLQIPWTLAAGMRDRLIHGYDDVDDDEVWATITTDIPKLIADLTSVVESSRGSGPASATP